jgi:dipeptidase E
MKLFLLSDTENLNSYLKSKFKSEIENYGNKIAYISSSPQDESRPWFKNTIREYKNINPEIELEYFDLSDKFSDSDLEKVLNFEIIHLSGGNTFEFLDFIRKRNFQKIIRSFIDKKLIIGVSAGAVLQTPTIEIAGIEDDNFIGMTDFTALNFVDFEFYPHFDPNSEKANDLKNYALKKKSIIYAATDHDGIFVEDGKVDLFGELAHYNLHLQQ